MFRETSLAEQLLREIKRIFVPLIKRNAREIRQIRNLNQRLFRQRMTTRQEHVRPHRKERLKR